MNGKPTTFEEWRRHHYEIEKDYARQILETPKGSDERRELFQQAYSDVIGNIIHCYDPGGAGTDYTDTVTAIVKSLPPSSHKDVTKVFDLGCGSGNLLVALAKEGYDVFGIDTSVPSIELAKQDLGPFGKSERVRRVDILDYNPPTKFDVVVMDNVIEHLLPDETPDVLSKCYSMLADEGYLVVITPHSFSGPHDVSKYFVPFGSKAEGFHLKEFSFTDLDQSLKRAGFQKVYGFPFHPKLLRKFQLTPEPSEWAARKSMMLEKMVQYWPFRKLLKLRGSTRLLTALAFPAVAVGVKKISL